MQGVMKYSNLRIECNVLSISCVRARARARVCVCVCVYLRIFEINFFSFSLFYYTTGNIKFF